MGKKHKKLLKQILKTEKMMLKILKALCLKKDITTEKHKAIAYVDGSYNDTYCIATYGVVFMCGNKKKNYSGIPTFLPAGASSSSTASEMAAVYVAARTAMEQRIKKLVINYDCEAVVDALTKPEKNPSKLVLWYRKMLKKASKHVKIKFRKVRAHSGIENNNLADSLARQLLRSEVAKTEKLAKMAKKRAARQRYKRNAALRAKLKNQFLPALPCKAIVIRKNTLPILFENE